MLLVFKKLINMTKMNLSIDETHLFDIPIKLKNSLITIGVINDDNNSLFHAILYAYSEQYIEYSPKKRMEYVIKMKKNLFNENKLFYKYLSLYCDDFYSANNDLLSKICVNKISLLSNNMPNDLYSVISEILPQDTFYKLVSDLFEKHSASNMIREQKFLNYFKTSLFSYLADIDDIKDIGEDKYQKILNIIFDVFSFIISIIYHCVENEEILILTKKLNRNLLFIDSYNNLPFSKYNIDVIENRKYIVLLYFQNNYQLIAELKNNNFIKKEFMFNDDTINTLKNYDVKDAPPLETEIEKEHDLDAVDEIENNEEVENDNQDEEDNSDEE
jgi:hypothetical protein